MHWHSGRSGTRGFSQRKVYNREKEYVHGDVKVEGEGIYCLLCNCKDAERVTERRKEGNGIEQKN